MAENPGWWITNERLQEVNQANILIGAVLTNDTAIVSEILDKGLNPQNKNAWDETALHHTSKLDNPGPMIDLLLSYGADPFARDKNGDAAIHWAAMRRNTQAIDGLINHPTRATDPNLPGSLWKTALHIAIEHGDVPSANLLLNDPRTRLDTKNGYGNDVETMINVFCPDYAGQRKDIKALYEARLNRQPYCSLEKSHIDHWRTNTSNPEIHKDASIRKK